MKRHKDLARNLVFTNNNLSLAMQRALATPKFKVGDRVAYTIQFLASIAMSHSEMAHARGTIVELNPLSSETILATIEWDKHDMPAKVNVHNLALVGNNSRFAKW